MTLQHVSQSNSRLAPLANAGLLVIQATIATTALSAFAPTNLGWLSASSASAHETQPSASVPGSVSTSAADLEPTPIVADCSAVFEIPVRLPHCPLIEELSGRAGGSPPKPIEYGLLRDAEREINQRIRLEIFSRERDSVEMRIVFPLP